MSAVSDFMNKFDEDGRYEAKDGVEPVTYLDRGGARHPGALHFAGCRCVRAEIEGYTGWAYEDNSPLMQVHFLLHFEGETPHGILIDDGRVVQQYDKGHVKG